MRKRLEVKAVWDDDIRTLFTNLGMLEDIVLGRLTCATCGKPVDLDNLGSIVPQVDEVKVTCDDTECIRSVTSQEVLAAGD